ncbi:MAG: hypothetical protein ABIR71_12170 [Chthoniobacterales bacterium]
MSFTGVVENDSIKLPSGMHLPDGTKVQIQPEEVEVPAPRAGETFAERFAEFIGCVDSSVRDRADNHDHSLYGRPKGTP